jgi:hypothetical protein
MVAAARALGWTAWLAGAALAGCAGPHTVCADDTNLVQRIYSGGGAAEWCRRPDGVREGGETRYYESGVELASGQYLDGAQNGIWRYRFNDGRNWRADRWDDGALVDKTIDPAVPGMSAARLEELGPMTSGIIKLAAHDPLPARESRDQGDVPFFSAYPNGHPRVAGQYDAEGLRTGVWSFWYDDGRPARQIEYRAGVRERAAREWHPNGAPAAEGFYQTGERDGRWRWWDARGRLVGERIYVAGTESPGGMLAPTK